MSMKLLFCMKNLSKFSKLPLIEIELNVKNLLKVLFFFFFVMKVILFEAEVR